MEGNDAQLAEHLGSADLSDAAVEPDGGGSNVVNVAPPVVPAMPDITQAQLVGLVPVVAKLGSAFGLFDLTPPEQEALTEALGAGVAVIAADAVIRLGRAQLVKVLAKARG